MNTNKGQIELIGLVVIVILITLGILFMAKFSLTDDSSNKKVIARELLAMSTMGALVKTSAFCEHYDYYGNPKKEYLEIQNELLEDCALYKNTDSEYKCDNQHSCDFLKKLIGDLLNQTLGVGMLNKNYEFKSVLVQNKKEIPLIYLTDEKGKGCRRKDVDSSKPYVLNTDAGNVLSVLKLCD